MASASATASMEGMLYLRISLAEYERLRVQFTDAVTVWPGFVHITLADLKLDATLLARNYDTLAADAARIFTEHWAVDERAGAPGGEAATAAGFRLTSCAQHGKFRVFHVEPLNDSTMTKIGHICNELEAVFQGITQQWSTTPLELLHITYDKYGGEASTQAPAVTVTAEDNHCFVFPHLELCVAGEPYNVINEPLPCDRECAVLKQFDLRRRVASKTINQPACIFCVEDVLRSRTDVIGAVHYPPHLYSNGGYTATRMRKLFLATKQRDHSAEHASTRAEGKTSASGGQRWTSLLDSNRPAATGLHQAPRGVARGRALSGTASSSDSKPKSTGL